MASGLLYLTPMGAIYNRHRPPSEGPNVTVLVIVASILGSGAGVGMTWIVKNAATKKREEPPLAVRPVKEPPAPNIVEIQNKSPDVKIHKAVTTPDAVAAITDKNSDVRRDAATTLGNDPDRAAEVRPALLHALRDPDADVRAAALDSLWNVARYRPSLIPYAMHDGTFPSAFRNVWADAGEADVEALAKLLGDLRSATRLQAAAALAALGSKSHDAVGPLAWAVRDVEPDVAEAAARALKELGSAAADAAPVLLEAAHSKIAGLHDAAFEALVAVDRTPLPALVRELKCTHAPIRRWARERIERAGRDAAPVLVDALKDASPRVRAAAAKILGDWRAPETAAPLIAASRDADPDVQAAVRSALMLFGDVAPNLLLDVLRAGDPALTSWAFNGLEHAGPDASAVLVEGAGDKRTRRLCSEILLRRGDPAAVTQLEAELANPDGERLWAARLLSSLGGAHAETAIAFYVEDFKAGGRSSAIELRAIGAPAIPSLKPLLSERDDALRLRVVGLLGDMGPAAATAMSPLIGVLGDRDPALREAAARALGKLGNPDAAPALLGALNDTEHSVRVAVTEALKRVQRN